MRQISELIIHNSASTWGSVMVIDKWHRERGFNSVGYNFVILNGKVSPKLTLPILNGMVEYGRAINKIPAHVRGHNRNSIGICLIGDTEFTKPQIHSLIILLEKLMAEFSAYKISGHYEYTSNKTCPNLDMDIIRSLVGFGKVFDFNRRVSKLNNVK